MAPTCGSDRSGPCPHRTCPHANDRSACSRSHQNRSCSRVVVVIAAAWHAIEGYADHPRVDLLQSLQSPARQDVPRFAGIHDEQHCVDLGGQDRCIGDGRGGGLSRIRISASACNPDNSSRMGARAKQLRRIGRHRPRGENPKPRHRCLLKQAVQAQIRLQQARWSRRRCCSGRRICVAAAASGLASTRITRLEAWARAILRLAAISDLPSWGDGLVTRSEPSRSPTAANCRFVRSTL